MIPLRAVNVESARSLVGRREEFGPNATGGGPGEPGTASCVSQPQRRGL